MSNKKPRKSSDSSSAKQPSLERLRAFVRDEGRKFLKDPNITSVGIGRKLTKGKTGEICVQFTVGKKAEGDQQIEALGSERIPETVQVDGLAVPTDVIQRSYQLSYQVLELEAKDVRKSRTDPMKPGVSISHPAGTAGTLGAIVYNTSDGAACVLSNWHVLHGPEGKLGDPFVQPGPFDDNRISLNQAGRLVRSHLGLAGDCAIARITGRGFDPSVHELGVSIRRIGQAELDDRVVKSGRTTAVTYGLIRRVDVIVKMNYGGGHQEEIGCFEIGPDPGHPAMDNEISKGGDSGSAWLALDERGAITDVMVGLHFAGEGQGNSDEHALACYAKAVFNKLEIQLDPPQPSGSGAISAMEATLGRGYQENFLGQRVRFPELDTVLNSDAYRLNGSPHLHYTHFSVCLSRQQRMARFVAWNIDGSAIKHYSRNGLRFKLDGRIPREVQIGNELYEDNKLDRGHIARRADLVWGSATEAKLANTDSFYFTNITPQHERFNQSGRHGLWGSLENAIFEDVDMDNLRVSVLAGPIFKPNDTPYRGVRVPSDFWKLIAYVENGVLKAKAYVLTQDDLLNDIEALELDEFRLWRIGVADLADLAGLSFEGLHEAETLRLEAIATEGARRPGARRVKEVLTRGDLFADG